MPDQAWQDMAAWARRVWPGGDPGPLAVEPIAADGSPRRFARLMAGGRSLVGLYAPDNPAENRAWAWLAGHLGRLGLPVAPVLAAEQAAGLFLMEDLGRVSLQEAALALAGDQEALAALYRTVLDLLAGMQARAADGLDLAICFDGPRLSGDFLFEREVGYFLREFVAGACGLGPQHWPAGLLEELRELSRLAGRAQPQGFVHRDFQSRNLLAGNGRLGLVDFQGGRLGPAQYDLAALLNDPYVDLPWGLRERLLRVYLELRTPLGGLDAGEFLAGWPHVALSRCMQTLGAYAFLTRQKAKPHFAAYVAPALATLRRLAARPEMGPFPALARLVDLLPADPPAELFQPPAGERP